MGELGWATDCRVHRVRAPCTCAAPCMVNVGKEMGTLTRTLEKKLEEAHKVPAAARMPVLLPIVQAMARSSKRQLGGNDEEGQSQSHSNAVLLARSNSGWPKIAVVRITQNEQYD
eukprot:scaffold10220_cov144-Isochrysis_galbana.AAC.17